MEQDKINAYMTLYTTLVTLAKISAPMVPFMTESIYRNLVCSIDKNAPEATVSYSVNEDKTAIVATAKLSDGTFIDGTNGIKELTRM